MTQKTLDRPVGASRVHSLMAKSFHRDSHRFIPSKKRQSPLNGRQLLPLAARAQKLHPTKTLITLCFYSFLFFGTAVAHEKTGKPASAGSVQASPDRKGGAGNKEIANTASKGIKVIMGWIDSSLGGQVVALQLKSERAELIAGNIANSDTPNYKARDIDFRAEFERRMSRELGGAMRTTSPMHMRAEGGGSSHITFKEEGAREDGNTVESEKEQASYTKNAIQYQVSLQFLNSKIRGLKLALKGE